MVRALQTQKRVARQRSAATAQPQQQQQPPQTLAPPLDAPQAMDESIFHLTVSRKEAARELQAAVKIGQAIRGQRIREMRDLDEARREKQEWFARTMETLARLVNTEQWCDAFNDFVPTILPEYAEFGMFVDVFEDEMRHRLGRLQALLKSLPEVPESPPLQAARQPHAEIGEVLDAALEAQPDVALIDDGGSPEAPQNESEPVVSQLETIYQPEATMPQQQQQLQQQSQQTVAAQILLDPEPSTAPRASGGNNSNANISRGALIVRTEDQPAAQSIGQFMEKLGLAVRVIDRRNPANGRSIMEELNSQSGSRFVLMLVDAASPGGTPDDLFDLGCCVGRMGAERVFALHRGGDNNTDRFGIAHVPIDDTEGWQLQLARLLRKAGVSVDLNKLV